MPFWPKCQTGLYKCHFDQMPLWPNATLTKCHSDQMPLWPNAFLTKMPSLFVQMSIDQMPNRTNAISNKMTNPKTFSNKKRLLKLYPSPSLQNFSPCILQCYDIYRMTLRMTLAEWRTVDQVLAEWHAAELHSAFLILLSDIELNKLECLTITFLLKVSCLRVKQGGLPGWSLTHKR